MKLLKVALLPLAIALSTSLAAAPISTALPSNTAKPTQTASQKSASQQVMFVVSAGEGSIHKKGSGYELSLDLNSIQQTLLFTERPARFVKYIQKQGIKQAWYDKNITHNFSENAPNAVLSTQDAKPGVITITQMHMHGSHVRFMFHPIKPRMFSIPVGKVHEVALTIDGTTVTLTGGWVAPLATGGAVVLVGGTALGVATAVSIKAEKAAADAASKAAPDAASKAAAEAAEASAEKQIGIDSDNQIAFDDGKELKSVGSRYVKPIDKANMIMARVKAKAAAKKKGEEFDEAKFKKNMEKSYEEAFDPKTQLKVIPEDKASSFEDEDEYLTNEQMANPALDIKAANPALDIKAANLASAAEAAGESGVGSVLGDALGVL